MEHGPMRRLLTGLFEAAVAAVDAERVVRDALRRRPRVVYGAVIATGKAAPAMARAASGLTGDAPMLVVSDHEEPVPAGARLVVSDHPVPTARSVGAGEAVLALASELGGDDRLLYLLSGGTSALVEVPRDGVAIAEVAALTAALLGAGASIHELNAVRSRLSSIKGGGLAAAAAPAGVTTLAISDVVDDDPSVIGSGPTADPPALHPESILDRYGLAASLSPAAASAIRDPVRRPPVQVDFEIVANGSTAAEGAAARARSLGLTAEVHPDPVVGEARDAARWAIERFRSSPGSDVMVLWGETTVTVRGGGSGGRNQEAALTAALVLEGAPGVAFLAAGTDGVDGPTSAAGGVVDGATAAMARRRGQDPEAALDRNDSAPWLAAVDAALVTGPTGTNVGDVWILARAGSAG